MKRLGVSARFALIAAVAATLIVLPVLALSIVTTSTVEQQLVERGEAERLQTAQIAVALADATLAGAANTLELLGRRAPVRDSLERSDRALLARVAADLRAGSASYASAAVLAPDGTMLAGEPDGGTNGQSFAGRDSFRGALASGRPFVSEVYQSLASPFESLVAVTLAVRDGSRVLGVLQVALAPAGVLRALDPVARVKGRELIVADRADRLIASTDPARLPLGDLGLAASRGGAATDSFRATIGGKEQLGTATPLASTDWTLYVLDDAALALAVQREVLRNLRFGAAATILVAILVGLLLASLYEASARKRDALALTEAELRRSNEGLEQAGRHKSEFLANMSHELRTPLNAILGFCQLLDEQLGPTITARQRRYLTNISDAGAHLLALINDVLDLSKVEAGRVELRPEVTTIQAVVEPVVSATRAAADARGVVFDSLVEIGTVEADSGRLRQVLYNLLSNAVKFTPPGGRVALRTWADGRDLHVEVADSGIGIPLDRQPRVFEVFGRVNEDRSDSSGTGLGLALTRQLVQLHSGSLTFHSAEGEGTTFTVVLPGVVPHPVVAVRGGEVLAAR